MQLTEIHSVVSETLRNARSDSALLRLEVLQPGPFVALEELLAVVALQG